MTSSDATVTVVGSYAVGITLRAPRLPIAGETLLADEFDHGPGGKGSNQAIQAARLGVRTRLLAAVGDDEFGRAAVELWEREGIDVDGVLRHAGMPTGAGVIVLDGRGENRILLYQGANAALDPVAVEARSEHIATANVVLTQLEIPVAAAAAALRTGREAGVTTVLNPAPARALSESILVLVDVLVPNESEARILCGRDPEPAIDELTVCRRLRELGARTVVLTRGARGALVVGEGEPVEIAAPIVDVVDTTGAGDAFNGTLASGLAAGEPLAAAVQRAVTAGALACTTLGVVPSLADRDRVENLMTEGVRRGRAALVLRSAHPHTRLLRRQGGSMTAKQPTFEHRLPSLPVPAGLFRVDSAAVLKRFFHLERALTVAAAAWIPAASRLDAKSTLARSAWEHALTGGELRNRVFELKYPDRSLDVGEDAPLVALYEAAQHAPSSVGLLRGMSEVLLPALADAYRSYLEDSDEIADAPTRRPLGLALGEIGDRIAAYREACARELASVGPSGEAVDVEASAWVDALARALADLDAGVRPSAVVAPGRAWSLAEEPGRDERYFAGSFYWPDNFDPAFPYGHGLALQLRSAVSHLNEVWAVDTAAANLVLLSPELGWEFVLDAARWLYDESRHMNMGRIRLERWGLRPEEIPLGAYIYEACRGEDPLIRLAMLAYFETKNIGKKRDRAEEFHAIGDEASARDLDFDWADEGIHAAYGRKWMKVMLERRGARADAWRGLLEHCEQLVARRVQAASAYERGVLRARVDALIEHATRLVGT